MRRWKVPIYASIVWASISIGFGVGLVWYVSSHPINPIVDDAREYKAGQAAGQLLGVGLAAIWGYVLIRARINPNSENQAGADPAGHPLEQT